MELNSVDRPNRFQVNPVVRKSVDTGDQQRYNNNVNCRDAESEDDTFNEDAANIIRRTSRWVLTLYLFDSICGGLLRDS